MEIHEYIRKKIEDLRLSKNLSESKLSEELGYNRAYLANMRKENSAPSFQALVAICNYFHISLSEFFANFVSDFAKTGTPIQFEIIEALMEKTSGLDKLDVLLDAIKVASKEDIQQAIEYLDKFRKWKTRK